MNNECEKRRKGNGELKERRKEEKTRGKKQN